VGGWGWLGMYWISERTTLAVASTRFVRNCSRSQAMCTLFEVRNSLMGDKVLSLCVLLVGKFLSRLDHETVVLWERALYSLLGRYECLGKFSYVFQSFFCSDGGSSRFFRNSECFLKSCRYSVKEFSAFYDKIRYDIFINCNYVVTWWQYTFTHEHYIEQHK
jgi:hypothetical protein